MDKVYLALYKGKKTGRKPTALLARLNDWLIRKLTKGVYSHCEIAVQTKINSRMFECYSSSVRDGGVRCKKMYLDLHKWDLIELELTEKQVKELFNKTQGKGYDWWGAVGIVLGVKQKRSKFFCSEWCGEAMGLKEPWRFSPNDLGAIAKALNHKYLALVKTHYTN